MDLKTLQKLAGINEFKGYTPYTNENISHTGTEKAQIQKDRNIQPGDPDWFELWFSRPYWLGMPAKFRGRTKR